MTKDTLRWLLATGLLAMACAHSESRKGQVAAAPEILVEDARYDGYSLKGRMLLHAVGGGAVLDGRLIENADSGFGDVRSCDGEPLPPLAAVDFFPEPARPEEIVRLSAGFWYGRDIQFRLFKQLGPPCLEIELLVFQVSPDGSHQQSLAARGRIRVSRAVVSP